MKKSNIFSAVFVLAFVLSACAAYADTFGIIGVEVPEGYLCEQDNGSLTIYNADDPAAFMVVIMEGLEHRDLEGAARLLWARMTNEEEEPQTYDSGGYMFGVNDLTNGDGVPGTVYVDDHSTKPSIAEGYYCALGVSRNVSDEDYFTVADSLATVLSSGKSSDDDDSGCSTGFGAAALCAAFAVFGAIRKFSCHKNSPKS